MECIVKGGGQHKQEVTFMEDICSNFSAPDNNTNNAAYSSTTVSGEDFFVDQLLNLNNNDEHPDDPPTTLDSAAVLLLVNNHNHNNQEEEEEEEEEEEDHFQEYNGTPTSHKISPPFLSPPLDSVLSVPADEADLEWLSHFVEESFSQFSTPYPPGLPKPKPNKELFQGPCFTPPNQSKARRSKRARTGGRVWSAALSDPSSPSATVPYYSPSPDPGPTKKHRKKETAVGGGFPRRCSHCGVHKTPQWRAGPMGAKTLCNACGVRFKSGRLLPEYRPACSPTFSSDIHSNSHRKVMEMRKKKEILVAGRPEPGSIPPSVSSFG